MRNVLLILLSATVLALAGCNTVAGAGQDLSSSSYWVKSKL